MLLEIRNHLSKQLVQLPLKCHCMLTDVKMLMRQLNPESDARNWQIHIILCIMSESSHCLFDFRQNIVAYEWFSAGSLRGVSMSEIPISI